MAQFTDSFNRLRNDFDRAYQDRQHLCEETRAAVRKMAEGVKDQMGRFAADMRATRATLHDNACRLRSELAGFADDLRAGGRIFRGAR